MEIEEERNMSRMSCWTLIYIFRSFPRFGYFPDISNSVCQSNRDWLWILVLLSVLVSVSSSVPRIYPYPVQSVFMSVCLYFLVLDLVLVFASISVSLTLCLSVALTLWVVFLVACTRLYKSLCRLVGSSIHPSHILISCILNPLMPLLDILRHF